MIIGTLVMPSIGLGRPGNLLGRYDSSSQAVVEAVPHVDTAATAEHDHNNPLTKNDVARGGEVGEGATDPTTSLQRAASATYVAAARRSPNPPLTTVRVMQKRQKFPQDRYAMANGCYRMAGRKTFFKPTDLGKYLLFTKRGTFRTADGTAAAASSETVWTAKRVKGKKRGRYTFTRGAETLTFKGKTSFRLMRGKGCASFPEATTNIVGRPHAGVTAYQEVRGYMDAHTHGMAFEFLGGRAHCGKPWDEFGVTVALVDCPDHTETGYGGVLEAFLSGEPSHDPVGWPTFKDWPAPESLTHEGTYYKWL